MSVAELYKQVVLEHNRAPRNFGALAGHTHAGDGDNPMCGDHLHCELRVVDGRIDAVRFAGEACAIATASASILGELIGGFDVAAVAQLREHFERFLAAESGEDAALGQLNALAELRHYPARRRCATLAFEALRAALSGTGAVTSTEAIESMTQHAQAAMNFRLADHGDIPALVALVESAYRGDSSRQGWTTEADLLQGQRTDPVSLAAVLDAPGSRVVLGFRDGELLACAHLEKHDGNACYFGMFSVRPNLQGGGIGREMMHECERQARDEMGCAVMDMTVIVQRRELIAWYERRGFKATGERKPFPYGDERFGLPQRDDLEFIVLAKPL